jgi:hypothetical protein
MTSRAPQLTQSVDDAACAVEGEHVLVVTLSGDGKICEELMCRVQVERALSPNKHCVFDIVSSLRRFRRFIFTPSMPREWYSSASAVFILHCQHLVASPESASTRKGDNLAKPEQVVR